jgi:chromosome segregation ATPase
MFKRIVCVGLVGVALSGLLFGREAFSHLRTSLGWVRQSVRESVPIEFEIRRARQMIQDLTPEIHRHMHLIAKEEVEVQQLAAQVAEHERSLAKSRREMERLTSDLQKKESRYVYCGRTYTPRQVQADLARRFEHYQAREATLTKLQQVLSARQQGLEAARDKLRAMQAAQRQLEVDVANLEARLEMVQVAQAAAACQFDDSKLARTRELLRQIGARIDVVEKLVQAEASFPGQIPLDEAATEDDLLQRVTAHLAREGHDEPSSMAIVLDETHED